MSDKIADLDQHCPGWRKMTHPNGRPMFNPDTGMMLNDKGNRSIFDDIDEGMDG